MQQVKELNEAIDNVSRLPENTPDEIEQKENAYRKLIKNESLRRLKIPADLQITPFFLEKTENNFAKRYLVTALTGKNLAFTIRDKDMVYHF